MTADIVERAGAYLMLGGLFDPELAEHDAVRDLVMDCRDEIIRLRAALLDVHATAKDNHLIANIARAALGEKP